MVKINKQIVSKAVASKVTYGGTNGKKYIVIHNTGNISAGANSQMHAKLQSNGNSRQASWQYQIGSDGIYQSFSDNAQCWHAGNKYYNQNSIGIEICVNSDGNYNKAIENAVELVKYLMKKHDIPLKNVIQHYTASGGKNCPAQIRAGKNGITWSKFKDMISGSKGSVSGSTSSSKPSKPKANDKLRVDGYWGIQTTLFLQKSLGTKQDGILSGQTRHSVTNALDSSTVEFGGGGSLVIRELQKLIGANVDGSIGAETIRKLQSYLGTAVDGVISRPSLVVKEMQRQLNSGDFGKKKASNSSSNSSNSSKPKANLKVDGSWGKATSKAAQHYFGLKIKDGVISGQPKNQSTRNIPSAKYGTTGSNLIRAMQRHYKSGTVDGVISGKSSLITAMQRKYGLSIVDGMVSNPSNLVKEIQRRLNKGSL